jgi:hypothetical protein
LPLGVLAQDEEPGQGDFGLLLSLLDAAQFLVLDATD